MFAAPFWKMDMKKKTKMIAAGVCTSLAAVLAVVSVIVFTRDNQVAEQDPSMADDRTTVPVKEKDPIIGTWQYPDGTMYRFGEDGKGAMTVEKYDYLYSYTTDGKNLHIDYDKPEVHDADYTYEVKDTVLHLVGGEGTARGEYDMSRVG